MSPESKPPNKSLPDGLEVLKRLDSFVPKKKPSQLFTVNPTSAEKLRKEKQKRKAQESQPTNRFTPIVATINENGKTEFVERENLDDPRVTDVIIESLMPSERFALALLYGSDSDNRISAKNIRNFMRLNKVTIDYEQLGGLVESMKETVVPHGLMIESFNEGSETFNSFYLRPLTSNLQNGEFTTQEQ